MVAPIWRIELLGELRAVSESHVLTRFYTHKIGGLLAYLALHPGHPHPRETLADLFWPDADSAQGRMSLRTALASLRRQLEPQGVEVGSVLLADRLSVCLDAEAVTTDVTEFERLLIEANSVESQAQIDALTRATALYRSDLLSGYSDNWVVLERRRLAEANLDALRRLAASLEVVGDYERALDHARRLVQANRLDEAAHANLIRLYLALDRPSAALRQYQELERSLRDALNIEPSLPLQRLIGSLQRSSGKPTASEKASAVSAAGSRFGSAAEGGADPRSIPSTIDGGAGTQSGIGAPLVHSQSTLPLPAAFTSFVGRETELDQIKDLLATADTHLVTLTGLGGSGKTRLALEVARRLREEGDRPVHFVSLVDVTSPQLVAEAIRQALRLPAAAAFDPLQQIADHLRDISAILVLDNFEQVVEAGRSVVQRLLTHCPHLACLVTSRIRLGLSGEWEFPVSPLPTPSAPGTPERLMEFDSVRLFVNRARAVRPDFRITPENAHAVTGLCSYLEGIPLAIELAAARAQVLTPAQMLQQVTNRFNFLVTRRRDAAERHRTLRAALEWSHQVLDGPRQRLLAWLSVFRGGWVLSGIEALDVNVAALDILMDLRDASLILTEECDGEMRFRMLETVREYAAETLAARGEVDIARRRHRDHYVQLAEEARPRLYGRDQAIWLSRLEQEHDNLRAALDFCAATEEGGEAGLRLITALLGFWDIKGYFAEGRERCLTALAHPGAAARTRLRASALGAAGSIAAEFPTTETKRDYAAAQRLHEEELAIARELGAPDAISSALCSLGKLARSRGDYAAARVRFEESLKYERAQGNDVTVAVILGNLGVVAHEMGDLATARALIQEHLEAKRAMGDRQGTAASLDRLGNIARSEGDFAAARTLIEKGLQIRREFGNRWGIAASLFSLGLLHYEAGDHEAARPLFAESLAIQELLGDAAGVAAARDMLERIARH